MSWLAGAIAENFRPSEDKYEFGRLHVSRCCISAGCAIHVVCLACFVHWAAHDWVQQEQDQLATPQDLEIRVASQHPRIYILENFLRPEECEFFKNQVGGRLKPAKVVQKAENKYDLQTSTRNNRQIWLTYREEKYTAILRHIIKRMHRTVRIPDDDAEAVQVGHYGIGEKYELHLDSDPQSGVARPATMIVYLNDVEEGGETLFPVHWQNKLACKGPLGIKSCCEANGTQPGAIRIRARRGRAVLFWNHDLSGRRDENIEHAACPVIVGEKWIIQRWFRFEPYQKIVHPSDARFDGLPAQSPLQHQANAQPGHLDARTISQKNPGIYIIEDFLNNDEVEHLRSIATTFPIEETIPGNITRRWVPSSEGEKTDEVFVAIAKRMYRAARVPEGWGENLQFAHYDAGSSMAFHHDSDPEQHLIRPLSMIVYLDGNGSLERAGATVFPRQMCKNVEDCCGTARIQTSSRGPFFIPPKSGRALLIKNHLLDGGLDHDAVHGSCPAAAHGKQILQMWFRDDFLNAESLKPDPTFDYPNNVPL